ncbi:F0F1 ATP synthase subunit I [gamma proteobacterium BDW918]|jgi:ATP synthase protein I|nr:F0F1 ATP synthase subunit I [gamma proteobacterium BDW918]
MTADRQRKIPRTAHQIARPPLLKIYGLQIAVVLLASVTALPLDMVAAYSIAIGGMISVIPNAYFARQVFRFTGAAYARQVTQGFYRGESGKFITTLGLFASAFVFVKPLQVFVLFLAYLIVMLLNAVLLATLKRGI